MGQAQQLHLQEEKEQLRQSSRVSPSRPSLLVLSLLCPPGQRGSLGCAGRDCPFLLGRGRQEQAWGLEESEGTKSQGMHRPLREDPKVQPALEIPAVPEGNGEPCASLRQRTCSD